MYLMFQNYTSLNFSVKFKNFTDIFLHNESCFLRRNINETYNVFDIIHQLDAFTSALISRFHDPNIENSIDINLRPKFCHSSHDFTCLSF